MPYEGQAPASHHDPFRDACIRLLERRRFLRDDEIDFLESNTKRPANFQYSEPQREWKKDIDERTFPVKGAGGYSNAELIRFVKPVICNASFEEEERFKELVAGDAEYLAKRDANWLLRLARTFSGI